MKIKVTPITNLSDARYYSAYGVDYFGFCLDALNTHAITLQQVKDIAQWLYEPVMVGEFGIHQNKTEIEYVAQQLSLNEIQIPVQHPERSTWAFPKFIQLDFSELHTVESTEDYFVLTLTDEQFQDATVVDFIQKNKVFLQAPSDTHLLAALLEKCKPFGIQIACRYEQQPEVNTSDYYAEVLEIIDNYRN